MGGSPWLSHPLLTLCWRDCAVSENLQIYNQVLPRQSHSSKTAKIKIIAYLQSQNTCVVTFTSLNYQICEKFQLTQTEPHDAASHLIDHHAVHRAGRWVLSISAGRRSTVDHTWPGLPSLDVVNTDRQLSLVTLGDLLWPDFLSPEFETMFQREVTLFLRYPDFLTIQCRISRKKPLSPKTVLSVQPFPYHIGLWGTHRHYWPIANTRTSITLADKSAWSLFYDWASFQIVSTS